MINVSATQSTNYLNEEFAIQTTASFPSMYIKTVEKAMSSGLGKGEIYEVIVRKEFQKEIIKQIENKIQEQINYIYKMDLKAPTIEFKKQVLNHLDPVNSKYKLINISGTPNSGLDLLLKRCWKQYQTKIQLTNPPDIWRIDGQSNEEDYWGAIQERLSSTNIPKQVICPLLFGKLMTQDIFIIVDWVHKEHHTTHQNIEVELAKFWNSFTSNLKNIGLLQPLHRLFIFVYTPAPIDLSTFEIPSEAFKKVQLPTIKKFEKSDFDEWLSYADVQRKKLDAVVQKPPKMPEYLLTVISEVFKTLKLPPKAREEVISLKF
jgi:hypothetical protein